MTILLLGLAIFLMTHSLRMYSAAPDFGQFGT